MAKQRKKKINLNKLFQYLWKYRFMYLGGMAMLVLVDYLDLYIPQITGEITDGLTSHTISADQITASCWRMVFCAALIMLGRLAYRYFIIGTSRTIERALQNDIFEKMETLSQRYFNQNKTGDLMAYFTNDLEAVREAIGWSIISAIDAVGLTFLCLYRMMVNVSFKLTMFTLIPMAVIGSLSYFAMTKMDQAFTERHESFAKLSDVVQESISAERVIKAFVQEEKQQQDFAAANDENRQVNLRLARIMATIWPVMEVLIGAAYVIAIGLGGYYCLTAEITLGKFVTFSSYVGTLVWPMIALGDCITYFTLGKAGMERINEVFRAQADIVDAEHPDDVRSLSGQISFNDVSFRYRKDLPEALQNISFDIRAGDTFAIMGRTGSGKSSIASLITRMYDATGGSITFDGHDIKHIPLKVLRENIAYVPQESILFSDTLAHNIAFGKSDASLEEIQEAAKIADIHDNIMEFPEQYDTMCGERGVTLSGGQKQRTAIARAILKDSPILIMDDSLSAVDTDTEDNILHRLKAARQGRTTIMIAHRVSTIAHTDHIIMLDDGVISEAGSYDQLVEADGEFARLVRKQQLEKQLAEETGGE
mgnify:CR=1 FL=1